ncbi:MAG: DUF2079 domain-containing protein [Candidatus Omnitrophota bacterium]
MADAINILDYIILAGELAILISLIAPVGFIPTFAGPAAVMLLLLALRYIIDKETFCQAIFARFLRRLMTIDDRLLLTSIFIVIFINLYSLSIIRHLSLSSGTDLGIFDQAIWNTLSNNFLFSSLKGNINLLGDHFEPILLVFVPFYRVYPSVNILFFAQALLLASAIFPFYLIAKRVTVNKILIFSLIFSLAFCRGLRGIAFFDFHPEAFILPLLFWSYYFLLKGEDTFFFISLFALLLCKEDTSFLISAFGAFIFLFYKKRLSGVVLFIAGLVSWFIITKVFILHFNPEWEHFYGNRMPFGSTYMQNFIAILHDPLLLPRHIFTGYNIKYIYQLLGPVAFLCLFSPIHWVLIAAPLFKNLIGPEAWCSVGAHYTAGVLPFVYIAAIYGVNRVIRVFAGKYALLGSVIIFSTLFLSGNTDGNKFHKYTSLIKKRNSIQELEQLNWIPQGASLATNSELVPHFSHRKFIFQWNSDLLARQLTKYIVINSDLLSNSKYQDNWFYNIDINGYKEIYTSPDKKWYVFYKPNV